MTIVPRDQWMKNIRENTSEKVIRWPRLKLAAEALYNNFEAWEKRNAEIINNFFDQWYFKWQESLINKFAEVKPDINFDDIKDEWINLALLWDDDWAQDFKLCIDKIPNDTIKKTFMQKIYSKIKSELGSSAPYDDFDGECAVPWDTGVIWYFQKILNYLTPKQDLEWWKKIEDIIKDLTVTNEDLNSALPAWEQIPSWVALTDSSIPENTRNCFDVLLSFEIGDVANYIIDASEEFSHKLEELYTNTFPAINTIVWESEDYKYDESKLWEEYESKLNEINNDTNLSDSDKEKKIKNLKRKYYLIYLKSQNASIWKALEKLYNNNFDYSKLDTPTLEWYIDKMVEIRMNKILDGWMGNALNLDFWDKDKFTEFYKKIAKPSETTIELRPWISFPVEKKIIEWENLRLKDIDEFWGRAKAYDFLPLSFSIKKSDIDALPLDMEDRIKLLNFLQRFDTGEENYLITWAEVWMIIYLFFVINSRTPITKFDSDKQQELERFLWKAKWHEGNWWEANGGENHSEESNSDDQNMEENNEWEEKYTPENFKEEIEKMWPGKFENWSEIWLPIWPSNLPGGWYQWMKIKISDIDMTKWTFKWKLHWWELDIEREWKTRDFKMTKKELDALKELASKAAGSDKVWLLPNPDDSSFNSFKDNLNGKLWTEDLSFPIKWITWDGDKFMRKVMNDDWKEENVPVTYFWAHADDKSTYKVEYHPKSRHFTVSSVFNWEKKWKDWKSETKRLSYERDMDWNNFLIFFTLKWLYPQTKQESDDVIARQDADFRVVNGWHWKLNWFTIDNLKHWFKDIFGALKKWMDEYNKKKDAQFRKSVESPLLRAMGAFPLLPPSIRTAIWERQQEIYYEEYNEARPEIEWYLKKLQGDDQFPDTFDQVPVHIQTLYWKSYKKFLEDLYYRKWDTTTQEKRKAAALLLANYEKWWSAFRGLSDYENTWFWVKILLWEAHYQQFKRCKAACIRERDLAESTKNSWLDKKWLNEELASCEMTYIINNIRWARKSLNSSHFPSYEERTIDGNKATNYIPNPSKRLLSDTFAKKLEDAWKWWFNKSTVDSTYSEYQKINRFEIMEDEFNKHASTRYQNWSWALRRMFDLASDETLKRRAKRYFLIYLLGGALDVNCDPWLKKKVYWWAKPMSFVPWMLVKEAWVAENVAILLDDATKWDFSKHVTKYFRRSGQLSSSPDCKWLQDEMKIRLTDSTMEKLDEYFSKLPMNDFPNVEDPEKKKVLEKFKKWLIEEDVEEFDRWLLDNPTIVNNGLLTNINVVSDRLRIDEWEFKWKDSDDINNKKLFWDNIGKSVSKLDASDSKTVDFVLNKYFTWFWLNSSQERQNVYKRINTAYHYKEKVLKHGGTYTPWYNKEIKKGWETVKELVPVWRIKRRDIDRILLYGLEWNVWSRPPLSWKILPKELKEALDEFQKFFKKAFDDNTLISKDVKDGAFKLNVGEYKENSRFLLWWWDVYKKIARKDDYTSVVESDDTEYSGSFYDLKESEQKKIWRSILRDEDLYINPHMENIEKTLKRNRNVLDGDRRLTMSEDTEQLLNLEQSLNTSNEDEEEIAMAA